MAPRLGAAKLACALCLLLLAGIAGAPEGRAQSQQEWQILQQRLQNLEGDFAALRAAVDLQAAEQAEAGGTEALLRLSRVEEILRENAGAMETISFQVQQMQQEAETYRRDAELRFEELEIRLAEAEAAAEAVAAEASAAAAEAAAAAERAVNAAGTAATAAAAATETAADLAAAPPSPAPAAPADATAQTGLPSGVTASAGEGLSVAAADASEEAFVVTGESLLDPGSAPEAPAAAEQAASEEDAALLENPFPDFSLTPEAEPSLDSSIEQAPGLVTDVDPELLPKPLGVIPADETEAEATDAAALDTGAGADGGINPRSLYQGNYALLEQTDFQTDASLQETAIAGFQDFVAGWPQHELAPDAQYWIGEIFYIREDYVAAAEAFLEGMKNYGTSPRAGDTMLKLGITLRLLEQPEKACAAFDELLFTDRFGRLSESARRRIDLERRLANC